MLRKRLPQQTAFHESASYIYTKGSGTVFVDLRAKLPADKKEDYYSYSAKQGMSRFLMIMRLRGMDS